MWKLLIFIILLITYTIAYFEFTTTYMPDSNGLLILKSQENITIKAYVNNSSIPAQVSKYSNSKMSMSHSRNMANDNLQQNSSNGFKGYKNNSNANSNNFGDTIPKNLTYPQMNPIINNEQGYQTRYN